MSLHSRHVVTGFDQATSLVLLSCHHLFELRTPNSALALHLTMSDLIADIAVNVAVNKTFHYLVPEN